MTHLVLSVDGSLQSAGLYMSDHLQDDVNVASTGTVVQRCLSRLKCHQWQQVSLSDPSGLLLIVKLVEEHNWQRPAFKGNANASTI